MTEKINKKNNQPKSKASIRKKCKICKKEIVGRQDKIFCSIQCKNNYHIRLRRVTKIATKRIDDILHRNRSILLELMGKNARQKKISKLFLDKKKFNYSYVTSFHTNNQGKLVYHVYDFSWMTFSDEEVLIRRKNQQRKA